MLNEDEDGECYRLYFARHYTMLKCLDWA